MVTEMILAIGENMRKKRGILQCVFGVSVCLAANAADFTIDAGDSVEWNRETKSYDTLYIGSKEGSGSLSATDSTQRSPRRQW